MEVTLFITSVLACATALEFFLRAVMRDIPRAFLTVPAIIFAWTYFVIVPVCNVVFDTYVDEQVFIDEPIRSLTQLNFVNAILLCIARVGCTLASRRRRKEVSPPPLNISAMVPALGALLTASVLLGLYTIYYSKNLLADASSGEGFQGTIFQYAIVEAAPIAFCWLVTLVYARLGVRPGTLIAMAILAVQLLLILGFSSSRGSRVAIISQLVICCQIFNYSIYRFKIRDYVLGGLFAALFLQVYAYYKYGGIGALQDYLSGRASSEAVEHYNNPVGFLVGDIGRADIQAPLLSRYRAGFLQPNYIGETYIGAISLVLPREVRPGSIRSKNVIGAEAQLDPGSVAEGYTGVVGLGGIFESSRIYGLLGETILNFGWAGLPVAFFLFGYVFRRAFLHLARITTYRELLTAPFFSFLPIYLLFYDSDNILVQAVSVWAVPVALLLVVERFASRRLTRTQ